MCVSQSKRESTAWRELERGRISGYTELQKKSKYFLLVSTKLQWQTERTDQVEREEDKRDF